MAASGSPGRSAGSWTSGASGASAAAIGEDGRQLLVVDADEPGRLLGGVERLGGDGGHRLAVVLRLADRQHRPIAPLRPEPRHRLRQVGGGHHEPDARDGERGAGVDRDDPRPGDSRAPRA